MTPLPHAITSLDAVHDMLDAIIRFTSEDMPFVAQVAQLARQASTHAEREHAIVSLYRLGLEHHQAYVSDLADELLLWLERDVAA